MKRSAILALVAAVLTGSVFGQEPNEHLKGYAPYIGTWRYEGPLLEEAPGMAAKGSKVVVQSSWTWILDNQVVMSDWCVESQDGTKMSGKDLIGWNAAERKIVGGGMNSMGGVGIDAVVIDGKTITASTEGVDGDGRKSSNKVVMKKTDEDTFTWQMVERTGGDVEGPSPVYTFKRVKRSKGEGLADEGEPSSMPPDHLKDLRPLVGAWRYEGPFLEDVPGLAKKGSNYVFQGTFRFILDKQVLMEDWMVEFADGKKFMVKGMTGWNAAEKKLVNGAMDSAGGMNLGTLEIDQEEETSTLTTKGIDGEGKPFSLKATGKKLDKDTLTWQALERTGGMVEGKSPVYTLKRVPRAKGKKVTN